MQWYQLSNEMLLYQETSSGRRAPPPGDCPVYNVTGNSLMAWRGARANTAAGLRGVTAPGSLRTGTPAPRGPTCCHRTCRMSPTSCVQAIGDRLQFPKGLPGMVAQTNLLPSSYL